LEEKVSAADKQRADRFALNWRRAPCEWSDVFAGG